MVSKNELHQKKTRFMSQLSVIIIASANTAQKVIYVSTRDHEKAQFNSLTIPSYSSLTRLHAQTTRKKCVLSEITDTIIGI
jgi:hypothetical protein